MDLDLATFWKAALFVVTLVVGVFLKQWLERKARLTYWLHSATGTTIEDPNDPANNCWTRNRHVSVVGVHPVDPGPER